MLKTETKKNEPLSIWRQWIPFCTQFKKFIFSKKQQEEKEVERKKLLNQIDCWREINLVEEKKKLKLKSILRRTDRKMTNLKLSTSLKKEG